MILILRNIRPSDLPIENEQGSIFDLIPELLDLIDCI
jgi:hypothetical protein